MHQALKFWMSVALAVTSTHALAETAPKTEFTRAIEAFKAGEYEHSTKILLELCASEPANALLWFNLGNAQYSLRRFKESVQSYDRVSQLRSPLAPAAELYAAQAERESENFLAASARLRALQGTDLKPGLARALSAEIDRFEEAALARAMDLYRLRQDHEAVELLKSVITLHAHAESYMMLGLAQLRLDQPQAAQEAFARAVELGGDPTIRSQAQELLSQIRSETYVGSPFYLWLDTAIGLNSNVYAVGSDAVSETMTEFQGALGYRWIQEHNQSVHLEYSMLFDRVFHQPTLDYLRHSVSAPMRWFFADWLAQLTPVYRYETSGRIPFLSQPGINANLQRSVGRHDFGISYGYSRSMGLKPIYEYMDGNSQSARAYWTYNLLRSQFRLSVLHTVTSQEDFVSTTSRLPLSNRMQGATLNGLIGLSESWTLDTQLSYYFSRYDRLAEPDQIARVDQAYSAYAKLGYAITDNLSAYVAETLLKNRSTLGPRNTTDKNYLQNIILAGLAWDIL